MQGISRLLAAGLLTAGALATPPAWLRGLSARTVMLAPIALVLLVTVIGFVFADRLPPLLGERALALLRESGAVHAKLPGPGLALLLLDTAIGGLYLAAALLYLRIARGPGGVSSGYLAIGLMVAAFSQLHLAIHPGTYTSLVTSGDILRVAFYAILLVGLGGRAPSRYPRAAPGRRRAATPPRGGARHRRSQERARLAREIHDGLAQDLWYAKLKQGRLHRPGAWTARARELAGEVADAIDRRPGGGAAGGHGHAPG